VPQVFRPVRWRVFGAAALVGLGVAVLALAWPGLPVLWRLAGLPLAALFAVSVAAPVAEQVEIDGDRVSVRSPLRAARVFTGQESSWSVVEVPVGRRRRRRGFDVLTLCGPDGRTADVLLKFYRAERKQQLLAALAAALPRSG